MLRIENLTKAFSNNLVAVNNVSMQVNAGEFLVVLGPSGSGKSTLLRLINGLLKPDSGRIFFNGKEIINCQEQEYRKKIGMIFQHYNLIENLKVINNVLTGALTRTNLFSSLLYLFPKKLKIQALQCLQKVQLLDKAYEPAKNLSGGQKQRVGIARAIMQESVIILADEPISNLDPMISYEILSLLKDICKTNNIPVICNLHQMDYALQFADRIVCLVGGKVVVNEDTKQLTSELILQAYMNSNLGMIFNYKN